MYESLADYNRKQRRIFIRGVVIPLTTVLTFIVGGWALVSCSYSKKQAEIEADSNTTNEELQKQIIGNVEPDSVKTLDVGEHIISVRVSYNHFNSNGQENNNLLAGYAVNNIPEGYEVFQITPYERYVGEGSETGGYDIWFRNTEPVEVHVTYNEVFNQYGYYTFGEVIEEEKVLEK